MNNKTIIEFSFRIIWKIMEISKDVFRRGRTRRITPSSISIILLMILSLVNADCRLTADYCLLGLENNETICHVFILFAWWKQNRKMHFIWASMYLARKYYMGTLLFLCKIYQEKLFGEVPDKNEDFLDYTNIVWLLNWHFSSR